MNSCRTPDVDGDLLLLASKTSVFILTVFFCKEVAASLLQPFVKPPPHDAQACQRVRHAFRLFLLPLFFSKVHAEQDF